MDNEQISCFEPDFEAINSKLLNINFKQNKRKKLFYDEIFSSFKSCGLIFKNHFSFINLCDTVLYKNFELDNKYEQFYYNVAKTGVGLIINSGIDFKFNKLVLNKHKSFVDKIHTYGTKIFMQLKCDYGRGGSNFINYSSSFNNDYKNANLQCIRISDSKCNNIINKFIKLTELSISSGYDGIVINGNMFNIVGELTSKEFNRRIFGYYNKLHDFTLKLLTKLSNYKKLPIIYEITLDSFLFQTIKNDLNNISTTSKIKESREFNSIVETLIMLVKSGVDGFIFSFGTFETEYYKNFNSFMCKNLYFDYYNEIVKVFDENKIKNKFNEKVIIIYNDNFNSYDKIQNYINNNLVEFIDITKNLYADNQYLIKIKNNQEFMPCINCCYCNDIAQFDNIVKCKINPNTFCDVLKEDIKHKNICVVGAGIAGVLCSIYLASNGHHVELFEKTNQVNKMLELEEIFGFDADIKSLNNYINNKLNYYINNNNIKLLLNNEFSSNQKYEYDSIIIATGGCEINKKINGIVLKNAKNIYDFLKNHHFVENYSKFCIFAESEISLKLSLYLLLNNKKVTIIIQKNSAIFNIPNALFTYYFYQFKKQNADVFFESSIKQNNIDFVEFYTNKNLLNSSSIVNALNLKSGITKEYLPTLISVDNDIFIYEPEFKENNKLFYDVVTSGYNGSIFMIGNALKISSLDEIIKSAYFVAKNL